ncbi:MAG TPA: peptidase MA family metallohydrolase, partial [Ktedonobacteraceae bacterium]
MSLRRFLLVLFLISCLLTLYFSPLATPRHAQALSMHASDAITITSQSYVVHFPNSITFTASASDADSTFVDASITVNIHTDAGVESHPQSISGSPRTLRLSWTQDTSGNNFMPAGSTIYYFWRFSDAAGDTFVEPMQQLTTVDTRFNWQHLTRGLLQVNWYNRPSDFGQKILDTASGDIQHTGNLLGGGLVDPVNLWVYQTDTDFHGSLPPGTYEWVGGIAFPSLDEASIVVGGLFDQTLTRDMPHELTHLIFHQLIKDGESSGVYAPTWFDEGLAVYNQIYHEPDMQYRLNQALATHSLLRLTDISDGFPSDADQAYLAYAQSWNLVGYMFKTFGQAKMDALIKDMDNPQNDFGQDLTLALGVDELHLENQWLLSLNQPGILPADQLTPTPQVTPKPSVQVNVSSDDRSWVLIASGSVLVVVSLGGLIVLFVAANRRRKQPVLVTATSNGQPAS